MSTNHLKILKKISKCLKNTNNYNKQIENNFKACIYQLINIK